MSYDAPASFKPRDMKFRNMGKTGLKVSVFSYGGWLTVGGSVASETTKDLIKCAWDHGVNLFDNAEAYSKGNSEIDMGKAFKDLGLKREELVITTKIFFGTGREDPNQRGLSRKHLIEGTRASLKRMQLDYVDIVYAHRPDPSVPMEEIVRAFNWIIDQGWAFYWGTSEWEAHQLKEAYAIADKLGLVGPAVEQPQYNLFHRQKCESDFVPLFEERGLGTTIWSPLASGLLTGKYNDGIPEGSRYANHADFFKNSVDALQSDEGKAKLDKVRKLTKVAERLGGSVGNLALAWCARNEHISSTILGATRVEQLEENFKALALIDKLTPEVLAEIEDIVGTKPENGTYKI